MEELKIHIDEPQVIVNVRGTRLTITYQVSPDGQSLVEDPFWTRHDRNAPISLNEFRRSAWCWQLVRGLAKSAGSVPSLPRPITSRRTELRALLRHRWNETNASASA